MFPREALKTIWRIFFVRAWQLLTKGPTKSDTLNTALAGLARKLELSLTIVFRRDLWNLKSIWWSLFQRVPVSNLSQISLRADSITHLLDSARRPLLLILVSRRTWKFSTRKTATIADISHYRHDRRWCTFPGPNNVVVHLKWQMSVMKLLSSCSLHLPKSFIILHLAWSICCGAWSFLTLTFHNFLRHILHDKGV